MPHSRPQLHPGGRSPACAGARSRPGDAGFGLIELVAVLIILAVLIAIGINLMLSARSTAFSRSMGTAARSYSDAVVAFRLNHRRAPVFGDASDWPQGPQGPLDAFGKPYVSGGVPDAVNDDFTGISDAADAASTGQHGRLVYERLDEQRYRFVVYAKTDSGFEEFCQVGSAADPKARPC